MSAEPTPSDPQPADANPDGVRDHGASGRRLFWWALVVAVVVVIADQASKWWAEAELGDGTTIPVIGDLIRFVLVYNPGAAFSIGTEYTWIFAIVAGLGAIALAWFAWRVRSVGWAIALGLLLGGALTHLGDRLFRAPGFGRGHVVDFIGYGDWFIGNVADIAIFAGAVMVLVLTLMGVSPTGRRSRDD
ncbi:signal peptidase II [Agromyces endophyticus]|uniref:signal peptidase II n=1 Tax=Agromyces sp. H17E-10 TaxID=2932244 RepID=UPI001FD5BA9D|nr:signal peptidase II [Agromyces sp. H17E-10]UOQ87852.1 signal peptidase II [Agromyces sp. H17E-10]